MDSQLRDFLEAAARWPSREEFAQGVREWSQSAGVTSAGFFVFDPFSQSWPPVPELSDREIAAPGLDLLAMLGAEPNRLFRDPESQRELREAGIDFAVLLTRAGGHKSVWLGQWQPGAGENPEGELRKIGGILSGWSIEIAGSYYNFHIQEQQLLGRMSPGMAHDLNNLLTPAWTFLQLAREQTADLHPPLREVAIQNLRAMRQYVEQALAFGRTQKAAFREFDLASLAEEAVARISLEATARKVELRMRFEATPVFVEADAALIHRLLSNLLRNALAASRPGSAVVLGIAGEGEDLLVTVTDHGPGFGPAFTDVPERPEEGLGLRICQKIMTLHAGALAIASSERGSVVTARFPRRQRPETGGAG